MPPSALPCLPACAPSPGTGRQPPGSWPRSPGSALESGAAPERGEGAGDAGIGAPDAPGRLKPRRRASPPGPPSKLCLYPHKRPPPSAAPKARRALPRAGAAPRGSPTGVDPYPPAPALLRPRAPRTAPPPRGGRGGDTYGVGGPTAAGAPRGAPWASLEGLSAAAQPAAPAHLLAALRTEGSRGRCASGAGTVRAAGRLAGSPPPRLPLLRTRPRSGSAEQDTYGRRELPGLPARFRRGARAGAAAAALRGVQGDLSLLKMTYWRGSGERLLFNFR